jgi:hypothetical protein
MVFYSLDSTLSLKDLYEKNVTQWLQYSLDITEIHDESLVIGKLNLSIRSKIPMQNALKDFIAQKLSIQASLKDGDQVNTLLVKIQRMKNLKCPNADRPPKIYVTYRIYRFDDVITVRNNTH